MDPYSLVYFGFGPPRIKPNGKKTIRTCIKRKSDFLWYSYFYKDIDTLLYSMIMI